LWSSESSFLRWGYIHKDLMVAAACVEEDECVGEAEA
jgi:hypothetical protein